MNYSNNYNPYPGYQQQAQQQNPYPQQQNTAPINPIIIQSSQQCQPANAYGYPTQGQPMYNLYPCGVCSYESNQLFNFLNNMANYFDSYNREIYRQALFIMKMQQAKEDKKEIIKRYSISKNSYENCLLFTVFKNDGSPESSIKIADFIITKKESTYFNDLYKTDKIYKITLHKNGMDTDVIITSNDLEPKNITKALNRYGFQLSVTSHMNEVKQAFINYIESFEDNTWVCIIPYNSGWRKEVDGYKYYISTNNPYGLKSPFFSNRFINTDGIKDTDNIEMAMGLYKDFFTDEKTRVIMLSSLIYSVLFTIYKEEYNLSIDKLLILGSSDYSNGLLRKTADMFLKLFEGTCYPGLNQGKKEIKKELVNTKDAPLVIIVNKGGDYYKYNSSLDFIKNVCVYNTAFENNNTNHTANCLTVLLGGNLEFELSDNEFMYLDISSENVHPEYISNFNFCKKSWTIFIREFIEFVSNCNNRINLIPESTDVPECISADNADAYILLVNSFATLKNFLEANGIDLINKLGITKSYKKIIEDYLCTEQYDSQVIAKLFIDKLHDLVRRHVLHEKYNNDFAPNEGTANIYIIKNEVWIRHQAITRYIVPEMLTPMKPPQVLAHLKNADMLILNKGTYECRRSVKNPNSSPQSFVILKREYYDASYKESVESVENKKTDYWGEPQFLTGGKTLMNNILLERSIGVSPNGSIIKTSTDTNAHVSIEGPSGSGKTYLCQNIVLQDFLNKIPVILIDMAGSFTNSELTRELKNVAADNIIVYDNYNIPINPFTLRRCSNDSNTREETPEEAGIRITSLFAENCRFGSQQRVAFLKTVISILSNRETPADFNSLINKLKICNSTAAAKLYPLTTCTRFSSADTDIWTDLLDRDNTNIIIFQLSSLEGIVLKLTVDIILNDLFKHLQINGRVDKPVTLVIDELSNANTSDGCIISKLLMESRKTGLSVITSTQVNSFKDYKLERLLRQSATCIYFKPGNSKDIKVLVNMLKTTGNLNWYEVIDQMSRGRCIVISNEPCIHEKDKLVHVYPADKLLAAFGYNEKQK